jgi:hypothetical protein
MLMFMPMLKVIVALVAKKLSAFYFKFQMYQTHRQTERQTTGMNKMRHCTTTGRAQWRGGREGKHIFIRKMDGWMSE